MFNSANDPQEIELDASFEPRNHADVQQKLILVSIIGYPFSYLLATGQHLYYQNQKLMTGFPTQLIIEI